MDPMLMAIIAAVVVVILAGVFFMKSRNKGDTTAPTTTTKPSAKPSNRPKTLAEQQREMAANPAPAVTPQPEIDYLAVAQQYFDQRDYSNAVTTLKSAITKQPNRADLQLLLLRSYAEQKNYAEFNHTYTSLNQLNDPTASAQATRLKQLLDEEQSFAANPSVAVAPVVAAAAIPAAAVAASVPDTLDFDDFSFEPDATPATSSPANHDALSLSDDSFSFDDLESQVLTTSQPAKTAMPTTPVAAADESSFDLTFDDFDITPPAMSATATPSSAPVSANTTSETLDFSDDLDFPELSVADLPTTPVVATSAKESEPSLEFEDFGFEDMAVTANDTAATHVAPAAANAPVSTSKAEPVADIEEFNFDFNDNTTAAQPTVEPISDSILDAAPTVAMPIENTANNAVLETYSLTSPAEPLTHDSHHETHHTSVSENVADFTDFDLSFDEPDNSSVVAETATNTTTQIAKTASSTDTLATLSEKPEEDFTFDFDDMTPASSHATGVQPTVAAQEIHQEKDDTFTFDLADEVSPVETPVVKNSAEFDSAILASKSPTQENSVEFDKDMAQADTLSQLDALYGHDMSATIPTTTPVNAYAIPDVIAPTQIEEVASVSATTSAPVTQVGGTDLSQTFAFINDIDSTQLNLDLAEQYIELGEYDSAKRLLNEISHATPTQQNTVTQLLDRIG